ncbi:MAG: hypothetical protein V1859_01665 [archaeon]
MKQNKTKTIQKIDKNKGNKEFITCTGQKIKTLMSLPIALRTMDDMCFSAHVNENKNDFAEWVINEIGQKNLGERMQEHKDKASLLKFLVDYLADKTLIQEELQNGSMANEKIPVGFFQNLIYKIKKTLHLKQIVKPNLSEAIRGRLFISKVKDISDLEVIFSESLEEYRWKVYSLKSRGENTQECQLYLGTTEMKIREFGQYVNEKNAIDILHLFYCLDDEIKKHENSKT